MNPPVVLTIAGSDSGGGAGVAADLATFAAHGVHGALVVTAVTAQDTTGVRAVHPVPLDVVAAQLDAVLDDLPPTVVKTGMLGTPEVVRLVAERCAGMTLVVDPVLRATSGADLGGDGVVEAYRRHLLPVATVSTPNADEDAALGHARAAATVVTGSGQRPDRLHRPDRPALDLPHPAVPTSNDHGSGCTYSAALAARLAQGTDLVTACELAAAYTTQQLRLGSGWSLGQGRGPVAHTHSTTTTTTTTTTTADRPDQEAPA